MASDNVSALVLPEWVVSSSEAQVVSGIPGRWLPGQPYLPAALGLTLAQAKDLIAEQGLPLEVVTVAAEDAAPTFSYAPGTRAPSGLVRTALPVSASEPVVNSQGDPVLTPPTPSPLDDPPWVESHIAQNDAYVRGDPVAGDSPITTSVPGVPIPETPDVGLTAIDTTDSPSPVLVEDPGYEAMKRDDLAELAAGRGIEFDGRPTKDDLVRELRAQDEAPSHGPVDLVVEDDG